MFQLLQLISMYSNSPVCFLLLMFKRSISEVQLMHNVGEHKQVVERQDWLQVKLKTILIPSLNDSQKGLKGRNRTLFPVISLPKAQTGS
uniref:Parathyroid hormone n=1 Tax=Electrophorus electricus TaxID=8005 RepID=A0A4W4G1C4_ELEEL